MISEDMSDMAEALLLRVTNAPEQDRTVTILYLSTYLMNHAGLLLSESSDPEVAQHYMDLTRMMESLLQDVRDTPRKPKSKPHRLTLVK